MILIAWLIAALAGAAEPTLPGVLAAAPPVYPAAALAEGVEGVVVLDVDVSAAGDVLAATVAESAGGAYAEAFDAAAVQAMLAYRFTPATDADGAPTPARIRYALRFEPAQAAVLSAEGEVRIAGSRTPLAGAEIRAAGPDGEQRVAVTDDEGRWQLAGLPDGTWTIRVLLPGYATEPVDVAVVAGSVAGVTSFAVPDRPWEAGEAAIELEVVGDRPFAEVTERTLSADDIRYLPGTNGDVVKVIQNLPGVARPPLGIGQLLIRGTAPEDSAYYVDGSEIPLVFHFAGLSTVINGDFLSEVSFLPGSYSVRYGRQLGGAVELRTRRTLPEDPISYAAIDLFQTTLFLEQKVRPDTSVTVSGRRSYIDAVLNPVFDAVDLGNVQAPRYFDGQLRVLHERPSGATVSALLFGSDDRFRILGDPGEPVDFGLGISFLKGQLQVRRPLGGDWTEETTLLLGPERQEFALGDESEAYERPWTTHLRREWTRPAGDGVVAWRLGVDAQAGTFAYKYDVEGFPGEDEVGDVLFLAPGAYVEPTITAGDLALTSGVRADGWWVDDPDVWLKTLDPRLSARYAASDSVTLKGAFGRFSQFPTPRQIDAATGNPDLGASDALQVSAGVEWTVAPGITLDVTGFRNALRGLVVGREDAFAFFTGPPPLGPLDAEPYANAGTGSSRGLELLARYEDDRTIAWLAGTLQRSTRTGRDGAESLFAYDQPVVLTALFTRELPKRWRFGSRIRYGSGNPYTPVTNRIWDLGSRTWLPVYGDVDSERLPSFWQLDARIDKEWRFRRWTLGFYLDAQNVTSRRNVEVIAWEPDYSAEAPITGLPIIPAFGLRGQW